MTIQKALEKVKSVCFSYSHELEKDADAVRSSSEETAKALEYEAQQLIKASNIVTEYILNSIDDGK